MILCFSQHQMHKLAKGPSWRFWWCQYVDCYLGRGRFSCREAKAGGNTGCVAHILQRDEAFSCVHLGSALIFLVFLGTADLNLIVLSKA